MVLCLPVFRSYYHLNHKRCRTSWAQISSTAAYCTWEKTKRLKIDCLVIKIAEAYDYMCACEGSQSSFPQREKPGLLDLLFSDEYMMDCATRRPRGMMGSGGRYRCISCRAHGQSPPEYKCSRGEHTLRIRVRPPPLGFIISSFPAYAGGSRQMPTRLIREPFIPAGRASPLL